MAPDDLSVLSLALSRFLDRVGEGPINLSVSLCEAAIVQDLRQQVIALEARLDELTKRYDHTEFLYRCEVSVNMQLLDLCKEHGITVRPALFDRPGK